MSEHEPRKKLAHPIDGLDFGIRVNQCTLLSKNYQRNENKKKKNYKYFICKA